MCFKFSFNLEGRIPTKFPSESKKRKPHLFYFPLFLEFSQVEKEERMPPQPPIHGTLAGQLCSLGTCLLSQGCCPNETCRSRAVLQQCT